MTQYYSQILISNYLKNKVDLLESANFQFVANKSEENEQN
jgi:hypothetical protein